MTPICDQSVTVEAVTAAVLESMESAPMDATEWLMAVGIIVALGIGVGGWIYDHVQRKKDRKRKEMAFAVLLYDDVIKARDEGRGIRDLLDEVLLILEDPDKGSYQQISGNPFASRIEPLLRFSTLITLEGSSAWAESIEPELVLRICKIRNDIQFWNDVASELADDDQSAISPETTTTLLNRLQSIEGKTLQVSGELADIMFDRSSS